MTPKHLAIRIEQLQTLAKASNCSRRKLAAMLIDPERNVVLADGYNGGPRGGGRLCGGEVCVREKMRIESGTMLELGCHHAEANVICNAAAGGISTRGAWLLVTGEPCLMCAKLIHHAGIVRVILVSGGYTTWAGVEYLEKHGVAVETVGRPVENDRERGDDSTGNPPGVLDAGGAC